MWCFPMPYLRMCGATTSLVIMAWVVATFADPAAGSSHTGTHHARCQELLSAPSGDSTCAARIRWLAVNKEGWSVRRATLDTGRNYPECAQAASLRCDAFSACRRALTSKADGSTCHQRIGWMVSVQKKTMEQAVAETAAAYPTCSGVKTERCELPTLCNVVLKAFNEDGSTCLARTIWLMQHRSLSTEAAMSAVASHHESCAVLKEMQFCNSGHCCASAVKHHLNRTHHGEGHHHHGEGHHHP